MGAQEFINGEKRWCLWLQGAQPSELRSLPQTLAHIEAVRKFRLESKAATTRKFAETPTLFCQIAQPDSDYLLVPGVSSERRKYVPIGFMPSTVIANNLVFIVPEATLFHFGILSSDMHMVWMRYTCERLESRYRYSKDIVYNNYPWPETPSSSPLSGGEQYSGDGQRSSSSPDKGRLGGVKVAAVEAAAQAVLDARAQFPQSSLADLYDPLTMPPALVKAHQALDRAVDACYRKAAFTSDAQRVEFLFERYQQLTSLLPAEKAPKKSKG
jgi:hypothetical protein